MQVTVENKSSVKKILHIEIPESEVTNQLDAAYKELKKTAKIKGFRPGKAPRSVIERMFKKDVHMDVTSRLIQNSLIEAIKAEDLSMIGRPEIDPPELNTSGPYKFDAAIEIKPKLDDIEYKELKLKKNKYLAGDKEVNSQIEMFRKNLARLETIKEKRPAAKGDFVIIDYEGFKDGKPFEITKNTKNFVMKIGGNIISNDFDEQLIGMNTDESKEFSVHFPDNYKNKDLANLDINFSVTLREIKEEVLPPADDELAKQLGNFKSLDELKEKIISNVQKGYDKRIDQELNEQIFTLLIAKKDFEVPDTLVDYELEATITDIERTFAYQNLSLEQLGQTREQLAEKYRDTAIKQVKRHVILDKLIEQENLSLTDEEMEEEYKNMAESVSQPVEAIKAYYKENKENLEFFKHTLLEKKAIRLIISHSIVEEIEPEESDASKKSSTNNSGE